MSLGVAPQILAPSIHPSIHPPVVHNTQALVLGRKFEKKGLFNHVVKDHILKDEPLFYRFSGAHDLQAVRMAHMPTAHLASPSWLVF